MFRYWRIIGVCDSKGASIVSFICYTRVRLLPGDVLLPGKWYTAKNKTLLRIIDMSQAFSTVSVAGQSQQMITRIGQLLTDNRLSVSCAESCTGGGLAFAFTSVAGSSNWFEQSFVTYSNDAKQSLLNVDAGILESYGAVSRQCVEAMAFGTAQRTGAPLAISVSGVAGPGGGSKNKPVGTVWFGFSLLGDTVSTKQHFAGNRHDVRSAAVHFALHYLHDWLVENYPQSL